MFGFPFDAAATDEEEQGPIVGTGKVDDVPSRASSSSVSTRAQPKPIGPLNAPISI
jgi:hypothetical protein